MLQIISAILVITFAIPAMADDLSEFFRCAPIKNSVKRLQCYDYVAKNGVQNGENEKAAQQAEQKLAKAQISAKDTYKSVRKLQTKIETGISYQNYSPALADAKFEVSLFAESSAAKEFPEFTTHLKNAMVYYDTANTVWQIKFDSHSKFVEDSNTVNALMAIYPKLERIENIGLHIDSSISALWGAASEEIEKATKLLDL